MHHSLNYQWKIFLCTASWVQLWKKCRRWSSTQKVLSKASCKYGLKANENYHLTCCLRQTLRQNYFSVYKSTYHITAEAQSNVNITFWILAVLIDVLWETTREVTDWDIMRLDSNIPGNKWRLVTSATNSFIMPHLSCHGYMWTDICSLRSYEFASQIGKFAPEFSKNAKPPSSPYTIAPEK